MIRVKDFRVSPSSEPEPVIGLDRAELMAAAGVRTDDGLKNEVERLGRHGILVASKDGRPTRWVTPTGEKRRRLYVLRGEGTLGDVSALCKRLRATDRDTGTKAPRVSVFGVNF